MRTHSKSQGLLQLTKAEFLRLLGLQEGIDGEVVAACCAALRRIRDDAVIMIDEAAELLRNVFTELGLWGSEESEQCVLDPEDLKPFHGFHLVEEA